MASLLRHLGVFLGTVALVATMANIGRAEPPPSLAKSLFESGTTHFNLGEWDAALKDFKEGYRLKHDPTFLFNIGQCYRNLPGHEAEAIRYFRNYLRDTKNPPNRADVERKIAVLEQSLRARPQTAPVAQTPPPTPAVITRAEPTAPIPTTARPPELSLVASAPPARVPVYKKWWLWTAVAGGAVALGLGLGLGLGLRSQPANQPVFPAVDF